MPTSKTVSALVTETEQGTHVFDIFGYSKQKGRGLSHYLCSGKFSVGGHYWIVFLRPDGVRFRRGIDNNYIAAGLVLASRDAMLRASYELRLINPITGLSVPVHKVAPREFYFNKDSPPHRNLDFFAQKRSVFETLAVIWEDRLTMECIVTVIKEPTRPENRFLKLWCRRRTSQSTLPGYWKKRRGWMSLSV
uniref:MATH domain-containing protein n=1 Tax=Arundo donax TaxID=35708 RepID=A0A0A9BKX1_ARUDO